MGGCQSNGACMNVIFEVTKMRTEFLIRNTDDRIRHGQPECTLEDNIKRGLIGAGLKCS
jgi:hypothetical protein